MPAGSWWPAVSVRWSRPCPLEIALRVRDWRMVFVGARGGDACWRRSASASAFRTSRTPRAPAEPARAGRGRARDLPPSALLVDRAARRHRRWARSWRCRACGRCRGSWRSKARTRAAAASHLLAMSGVHAARLPRPRHVRHAARASRHPRAAPVRRRLRAQPRRACADRARKCPGRCCGGRCSASARRANVLGFAALNEGFPRELAGRTNTSLNLLMFAGSFVVQWGVGAGGRRRARWRPASSTADGAARARSGSSSPCYVVAFAWFFARLAARHGTRGRRLRRLKDRACTSTSSASAARSWAASPPSPRRPGHRVTGCDANVYPPMSTQLEALGIELTEGYDAAQLRRRGARRRRLRDRQRRLARQSADGSDPRRGAAPTSPGPQWLYENVLARPLGAGGGRHARQDHHDVDARVDPRARRARARAS